MGCRTRSLKSFYLSDLLTSRIFRRLDGPSIADQSGTLQNMRPPDSKSCLQSE